MRGKQRNVDPKINRVGHMVRRMIGDNEHLLPPIPLNALPCFTHILLLPTVLQNVTI
jgi:hypothetical protein